jgi:hypothetical protein
MTVDHGGSNPISAVTFRALLVQLAELLNGSVKTIRRFV